MHFFKRFKINKKGIYGKSIFDFSVKRKEIPNLKKLLSDVLVKNIPVDELELTHTFEKAGEKTLILGARRIVLDGYKTKLILLSIEDISERKKKEAHKDDFVGYVTHELKTPLTSLSMFVQILTGYHKKTDDKKSLFLLEKAATQIERLTKLLDSFSGVYKAQNGKLELQKEKVDVNKLMREVVETFQYTQNTHEIKHTGTIKKQILIDKERIYEVLVNLLTNAIKYSPDSDKINIKLTEDDKKITISVQDFGFGIPQDEKEMVFERFFRVKSKEENKIKGLGLGLYLVNEIIKAHKGKLWVESREGQGSIFYFSLPKK
ncbi:MAG TPA: HAMP domain-containing sensor histidine kinase [Candidatus Limnocylindrales bacterium]|nr:HAMP domain-containing sensor histidine kinase [Candidatus Limnocylindrales bacterium]